MHNSLLGLRARDVAKTFNVFVHFGLHPKFLNYNIFSSALRITRSSQFRI